MFQEMMCFTILHWCYSIANLAITGCWTKPPQKWVQRISTGGCTFAKQILKVLGPYSLAICDQHIFFPWLWSALSHSALVHKPPWAHHKTSTYGACHHLPAVHQPWLSTTDPSSDITDLDSMVNLPGSRLVRSWIWVSQHNLTSALSRSWIAVWWPLILFWSSPHGKSTVCLQSHTCAIWSTIPFGEGFRRRQCSNRLIHSFSHLAFLFCFSALTWTAA